MLNISQVPGRAFVWSNEYPPQSRKQQITLISGTAHLPTRLSADSGRVLLRCG
ncbi:hypothetical protein BDZ89DRAFT_1060879, partial [Hymenopellis radicata]